MRTNLLKLNDSKTIMVGSKQNLLKADAKNTAVQIGNNYIICVDTVCDLGSMNSNPLHTLTSYLVHFMTIRKIARIKTPD